MDNEDRWDLAADLDHLRRLEERAQVMYRGHRLSALERDIVIKFLAAARERQLNAAKRNKYIP